MDVPDETNILKLLVIVEEPLKPDMIIEVNRRFIHTKDYNELFLNACDRIEIIHLDIGG